MVRPIEKELNGYISLLSQSQKKSLLVVIKSIIQKQSDQEIDLAQYNKEIEEAIARMDSGIFISQEDIERESAKW